MILETPRLILRPFTPEDVDQVVALCNDWELAKTTLGMPHPYETQHFTGWQARHAQQMENDVAYELAIADKAAGTVMGAISIMGISQQHRHGEIGYWIGREYWGRGYATEAAKALVDFCFQEKNFHRIIGRHFSCNPASGKVMQKIGMTYEGTQREQYFRNDAWQDVVFYGLLRSQWNK